MNNDIIEQIRKRAKTDPAIVIVPNGFVTTTQSLLIQDSDCLLNLRILTFSTLFRLLCDESCDTSNYQILDNKTAVLYLWLAIFDVRHKLTWFNKNVNHYSLSEKLMATFTQLNEEQIDINNLPNSPKFNDIKIINQKYEELTKDFFCKNKIMDWLIGNICKSNIIQMSHIFVAGFLFPTKQQSEVIKTLGQHSKYLTVAAPKTNSIANSFIFKCENVFNEASRIANAIRQIVNEGARYNEIKIIIDKNSQHIYENIFRIHDIPYNCPEVIKIRLPHIETLTCKTVSEFCESLNAIELQPIVDKVKTILGEMPIYHREFIKMIEAQSTQSKKQNYFDRVTLTTLQDFIPHDIPFLFITNATEGTFPNLKSDTGVITKKDNIAVNDVQTINNQIRAHALNVLSSATKRLYVSYATTNAQGEQSRLSGLASNTLTESQSHDEQITSPSYAKTQVMTAIGSGKAFEAPTYWSSVQAALDLEAFLIPDIDKTNNNISIGKQLFLPDNSLRVTQIENFVKCPFNHFLTQGLKLKKKTNQALTSSDVGTILHKFAEVFVKDTTAEIETIFENITSKFNITAFTRTALLNRCKQIAKFLTNDIETSPYKPTLFEHQIESILDGVKLRGVIDRVDTNGKHAFIIDYKSGSVSGPKLQLPLYMSFLSQKYIPDGSYYISLKTFKKTEISVDEIGPAIDTTKEVLQHINNGVIYARPYDVSTCKYCIAGAMCHKRFSKMEGDE